MLGGVSRGTAAVLLASWTALTATAADAAAAGPRREATL